MTFFIGKELGIEVKKTDVSIKASLDPAKFAGTDRSVRAGYQKIHVTLKVDAEATPEQLEKLRSEAGARCPVTTGRSTTSRVGHPSGFFNGSPLRAVPRGSGSSA